MKRPVLQNKRVGVLRTVSRDRKVFGTFEKRVWGRFNRDGRLQETASGYSLATHVNRRSKSDHF